MGAKLPGAGKTGKFHEGRYPQGAALVKPGIQIAEEATGPAQRAMLLSAETAIDVYGYWGIGTAAATIELLVLYVSALNIMGQLLQPIKETNSEPLYAAAILIYLAVGSIFTYFLGRLHVEALPKLFPEESRKLFANLLLITGLVTCSVLLYSIGFLSTPLNGLPVIFYYLGCLLGFKRFRTESSQQHKQLSILQSTVHDILNSNDLVDMNNKARAAINALGKKCRDDEQAVTVLLDNLVKAKHMNEAEQISHRYLKFVEQQASKDSQ